MRNFGETRLHASDVGWIVALATLTLGTNLGGASRLTYHEAIVAQGAREMLTSGDWLVPTLANLPWLEKPPLAHWLVMATARDWLQVPSEALARLPFALAAIALAIAVSGLAAARFGRLVGLLAGLIQVTTVWTVARGRLAESDILLVALVTFAIFVFDRIRLALPAAEKGDMSSDGLPGKARVLSWVFFVLLGLTSLAKGIAFGAVLVVATIVMTIVFERRWSLAKRLVMHPGWFLAAGISLVWPSLILLRHPGAWEVWTTHVTDRLNLQSQHFAGELWWEYALSPLWQTLPWTPLAIVGAYRSWRRARQGNSSHILLWAWAVVPAALVSLASTRNSHYLLYALPPWSIWGAIGLSRVIERLRLRGIAPARIRFGVTGLFVTLGLAYGLGIGLLGPRLDHRGAEWAFYGDAASRIGPSEPILLLYDDWDRLPYPTPFGPIPHDLPVRLYYLNRPASWSVVREPRATLQGSTPGLPISVIARERDLPYLSSLGRVTRVLEGPRKRWDRAFTLYRVTESQTRVATSKIVR